MSTYAEIVTELTIAREVAGLSMRGLSEQAHMSVSEISIWERGIASPRAANLVRWAAALGFDIELVKREAS